MEPNGWLSMLAYKHTLLQVPSRDSSTLAQNFRPLLQQLGRSSTKWQRDKRHMMLMDSHSFFCPPPPPEGAKKTQKLTLYAASRTAVTESDKHATS